MKEYIRDEKEEYKKKKKQLYFIAIQYNFIYIHDIHRDLEIEVKQREMLQNTHISAQSFLFSCFVYSQTNMYLFRFFKKK